MENGEVRGRRILVTGATGFIGSRLARRLAREGAVVRGVGRKVERVRWLEEEGVELVRGDLLDPSVRAAIVADRDLVFHTAAALSADADAAQAINVDATRQLVQAGVRSGVQRFVHVSTVGAYAIDEEGAVSEETTLATRHPSTYPRTKAQAEIAAREVAAGGQIELVILRPSMVYGPGYGVWTVTMSRNVCEGKPVMLGKGRGHFHPVYVDDLVEALLRAATVPEAAGEAFNVSAATTTWHEFMSYYGRLCGAEPSGIPFWIARLLAFLNRLPFIHTPIDRGFIEMATNRNHFPIEKARRVLGWEPAVELEEGMQRTAEWLREEEILEGTT